MSQLIEEFLLYLRIEKGASSHTQAAYRRDLFQLYSFVEKRENQWPPDAQTVYAFLQSQGKKKPSSQARALATIKHFLKYLFRESYISENVSALLETPKLGLSLPSIFTTHEIEKILAQIDCSVLSGLRDYAMIELLYGAGVRVSELCSLKQKDLVDECIKVMGKGQKERLVPLGKQAQIALQKYLHVQQSVSKEHKLFVQDNGRAVTRFFVWRMVKRYAANAGITKKISPHTFRHTYASHLLDAGTDPRVIQELLGHSSISSTDRYTHLSTHQVREVFRTFHPRWKHSNTTESAVDSLVDS